MRTARKNILEARELGLSNKSLRSLTYLGSSLVNGVKEVTLGSLKI